MTLFLISLAVLIGGYLIYGVVVERVFGIDPKRLTPASSHPDGVDYVPLPAWKVFLIQFLNIAGIGPIFGAIMGVMYGPAAFLWISLGTIFGGAVHDFLSAMMSLRADGKSLPHLVGAELGRTVQNVMGLFTVFLLIMVVAVFVTTPAGLLASLTPDHLSVTFWTIVIFAYYILATLLPIDKLIGRLYPIFGLALLVMALGIMGYLLFSGITIPVDLADGFGNRMPDPEATPLFPMMFVSIACGAISGFHATQSPMMARCLKNEKLARPVFYGAMVAEGIVALIWAAAAIAFCGSYRAIGEFVATHEGGTGELVNTICRNWLGVAGGLFAILGVIAAPVTTGDTAMRSARLIIADTFSISQKSVVRRLLVSLPIIVVSFLLMQIDFSVLWRYFAWSNQTLSVFTLWAVTVYLARRRRFFYITLLPAMFMTMVCCSYIIFAPLGTPVDGIGLPVNTAIALSGAVTLLFLCLFIRGERRRRIRKD
ncbi:MAG: carbon starvation protein A [Barnesiella sp.]|nr:carbon starvation protein A [Barnesiella sp.]